MDQIFRIETISELNSLFGEGKPKHPLVTVVDFSKVGSFTNETTKIATGFYTLMFKNNCHGKFKYGREYYDFQDGTLICVGPNQVGSVENDDDIQGDVKGWGLFFHPDLIRGTSLGQKIKEYSFFSYEMNEALHLSEKEKSILFECIQKIETELSENIDKHSQRLIVSNIELLLNYCDRYYDRQFITRINVNKDILTKFENILNDYFADKDLKTKGLPTVKYCADKLFLSANYLSDLLKKETGKNAQDHIHYYLIEESKNFLLNSNNSVSEIAYELGFEYPQYFSKLFKTKTGFTPLEFRNSN